MRCPDRTVEWLVYVIEDLGWAQQWFLWCANLGDWVDDTERATLYEAAEADALALRLSDEHQVNALVIRAGDVI